jgi:hypothetical protein
VPSVELIKEVCYRRSFPNKKVKLVEKLIILAWDLLVDTPMLLAFFHPEGIDVLFVQN